MYSTPPTASRGRRGRRAQVSSSPISLTRRDGRADLDPKFFSYSTLTNSVLDAVVKVADGTCDVGVTSLINAIIEPSASWTSLPVQDLIIYQTSVASDASNTKDRCYARAFQDFINAPEQQHDWVAGGFLPAN